MHQTCKRSEKESLTAITTALGEIYSEKTSVVMNISGTNDPAQILIGSLAFLEFVYQGARLVHNDWYSTFGHCYEKKEPTASLRIYYTLQHEKGERKEQELCLPIRLLPCGKVFRADLPLRPAKPWRTAFNSEAQATWVDNTSERTTKDPYAALSLGITLNHTLSTEVFKEKGRITEIVFSHGMQERRTRCQYLIESCTRKLSGRLKGVLP